MACLFGARLWQSAAHRSPANVTLVGQWQAQIDAVRRYGLTLIELDGSANTFPLAITNDPTSIDAVDVALILVKSYQTIEAAQRAAAMLKPDGLTLTLQNGLGNLELLSATLGNVAVGTISAGATVEQAGRVRVGGDGGLTVALPTGHQLVQRLARAGFATTCVTDGQALLWGKAAINAAINPLAALRQQTNGALAANDESRDIMAAAATEAEAVAAALGIKLPYPDAAAAALAVAEKTATNRASMWQDVLRGAPTEIDAINGAIVRYGRQTGVPTPINLHLYNSVIRLEATRSPST